MRIGPAIIATAIMIATPIVVANVSLPTIPALAQTRPSLLKIEQYSIPDRDPNWALAGYHSTNLKITSIADDNVIIQSVTLNRGNCSYGE
jgi:hypothetical protein